MKFIKPEESRKGVRVGDFIKGGVYVNGHSSNVFLAVSEYQLISLANGNPTRVGPCDIMLEVDATLTYTYK